MRVLAFAGLFLLAACGDKSAESVDTPAAPVEPAGVNASDELPGLAAPATGIAFWTHPNVAFNSMLIVASADGVASYNIEDGNQVSQIPGVTAQGAAVSYFGIGAEATGILAFYNKTDNRFEFHKIDNASRSFQKINGGQDMRGNVRDFCFGRADTVEAPSLFVIQKGEITVHNLALEGVAITSGDPTLIETPDTIVSCAVDSDGVLLAAAQNGEIYRLDGEHGFAAPFAKATISQAGALGVIAAAAPSSENTASVYGQILLLDRTSGDVILFQRGNGELLGAVNVKPEATADGSEPFPLPAASIMGVTGANLGAIYRNGVIALGDASDAPAIRLLPVNGIFNALPMKQGEPVSPRGAAAQEENGLMIDVVIDPVSE